MTGGPETEITSANSTTGREFGIHAIFFENGCFLTINEGDYRIGAVAASIGTSGGRVNTAKVIPSKHDAVFLTTVSEKVASMINGISLVSLHCKVALQLEDMKAIMEVVMGIIKGKTEHERQG
jgi:hypothetical protein